MSQPLAQLRLTGARVLRGGGLVAEELAIAEGVVQSEAAAALPELALDGHLVLPGIVDLHARWLDTGQGWPARPLPPRVALNEACRQAARAGITTAQLSLGWSWEGGASSPEACLATLRAMEETTGARLVDLRAQIRCETHTMDSRDRLLAALRRYRVDSVLLSDSLDAARQQSLLSPEALARQAHAARRSLSQHRAVLEEAHDRRREVPRHLCRLAEGFDLLGLRYGSLRDATGESREYYSQIGARTCALPAQRSAAALALAVGDPLLLSAAEMLRPSLGNRNLARSLVQDIARDLCRAAACPQRAKNAAVQHASRSLTALVSEDKPGALVEAAFWLVEAGLCDLPLAWALLSEQPAQIAGLRDRGRLAAGLRADLLVVNPKRRSIEATFCGGRLAYLSPTMRPRMPVQMDLAGLTVPGPEALTLRE